MAAIEQIVGEIEGLSALDLSKLVKALEEKFGVSAAAPMMAMAAAPGAGGAAAAVEEQTEFDAILGDRRQEDSGHQSRPGTDGIGPERGQGFGRWGAQAREGKGLEARSRDDQDEIDGSRSHGRD